MDQFNLNSTPFSQPSTQETGWSDYSWSTSPTPARFFQSSAVAQTPPFSQPNPTESELQSTQGSQVVFQVTDQFGGSTGEAKKRPLTEEELVHVIRWCIQNQDHYRDKNYTRGRFWDDCSDFIKEDLRVLLKQPLRCVKTAMKRREKEIQEQLLASGRATSETELHQSLDAWIEITGDIEACENRRKADKAREENELRDAHERNRSRLMTRQTARVRDDITDDEETPASEGRSPSQSSTTSRDHRRKRIRRQELADSDSPLNHLTASLDSLTSTLRTSLQPVPEVSEDSQGLKDQMREMKMEMDSRFSAMMEILRDIQRSR